MKRPLPPLTGRAEEGPARAVPPFRFTNRGKSMTVYEMSMALGCVLMIATGQVLFKAVGQGLVTTGSALNLRVLVPAVAAGVLYVVATLAWIWLLRTAPLSRAYPYMALSFVLVPLMSALFYREALSMQYIVGIALVVAGIMVAGLDARA